MQAYTEVRACRICGNTALQPVLSLGVQALTGVFPRSPEVPVTRGPVDLVRCVGGPDHCGLVQLRQTYDKQEMYGGAYGYRSGLNPSMVAHLHATVAHLLERFPLRPGDLVLDIGSNDGTLLKAYGKGPRLLGIDPTGARFAHHYPDHISLIPDFFSARRVRNSVGPAKARIITSIAMFYDLDAPLDFVRQIRELLADDGVWLLEQSYLPAMFEAHAYDTICHEHVEYYGLRQIIWMARRAGLRVIDVRRHAVNGGSFAVEIVREESSHKSNEQAVAACLAAEQPYRDEAVYRDFSAAVMRHREAMQTFFAERRQAGELVLGLGASTKGNVILQFCGIGCEELPAIGEVNPDKFGCVTPGTHIPIVEEDALRARQPAVLLVLPWHFKPFFLKKEAAFLQAGGQLFFPLPTPHVC